MLCWYIPLITVACVAGGWAVGRRAHRLLTSSPRPGRACSIGGSISLLIPCQPSVWVELQLQEGSCFLMRGGQFSKYFPFSLNLCLFRLLRREQKARDELHKINIFIFVVRTGQGADHESLNSIIL